MVCARVYGLATSACSSPTKRVTAPFAVERLPLLREALHSHMRFRPECPTRSLSD